MLHVIDVKDLSFSYGSTKVFQNIQFALPKNKFVALMGTNGAGKSTFLKLLLGELKSESGSIQILGQPVSKFRKWAHIGYVPQIGLSKQMDFPATVKEVVQANLYASIGLFCFPGKKEKEKVLQALSLVHMDGFENRLIGQLSGGQRQRILLARALVSNPEVMILDEPTTGMDYESTQSFYELLLQLREKMGVTILMVTHDIPRVQEIVDKAFWLENGALIENHDNCNPHACYHKHT